MEYFLFTPKASGEEQQNIQEFKKTFEAVLEEIQRKFKSKPAISEDYMINKQYLDKGSFLENFNCFHGLK